MYPSKFSIRDRITSDKTSKNFEIRLEHNERVTLTKDLKKSRNSLLKFKSEAAAQFPNYGHLKPTAQKLVLV